LALGLHKSLGRVVTSLAMAPNPDYWAVLEASEPESDTEAQKYPIPGFICKAVLDIAESRNVLERTKIDSRAEALKPFLGIELVADASDSVGRYNFKQRDAEISLPGGIIKKRSAEIRPIS